MISHTKVAILSLCTHSCVPHAGGGGAGHAEGDGGAGHAEGDGGAGHAEGGGGSARGTTCRFLHKG